MKKSFNIMGVLFCLVSGIYIITFLAGGVQDEQLLTTGLLALIIGNIFFIRGGD